MDRTVRENALSLADQIVHAKAGDDPMLPGVLRGLSLVIGRYLDGKPPETAVADGGIHPAHKRMLELLEERGEQGATIGLLWSLLRAEGLTVARETVHRWLAADERQGLVRRPGRPHRPVSRWVCVKPPTMFQAGPPVM
jgi:hypothetical protein